MGQLISFKEARWIFSMVMNLINTAFMLMKSISSDKLIVANLCKILKKIGCNDSAVARARHFPLPDGPGQVKLPVGQVDLDRFFFFISYKQIEEFQNSWSRASDDFERRRALAVAAP